MQLLECYIQNFGVLSAKRVSFSEGLNCIKEDNGSGKTTLSVFIKVMLYGMSDTKKTDVSENERKHYLPWQGGVFGGSLTFAARGKKYRVERTFSKKPSEDTFALYDAELGKPCTDFPENIGLELFGIDADGFERTVFLSERRLSPESENKSVAAKLSDLVGVDGDIGVMDEAMKVLEAQRKLYYKKGGGGKISDTRAELSRTEAEISRLNEINATIPERRRVIAEKSKRLAEIELESRRVSEGRAAAALRESEGEYIRRYEGMRAELSRLEKRQEELYEFFGGRIPSLREVEEAAYRNERAIQLSSDEGSTKKAEPEKDEFSEIAADSIKELLELLNAARKAESEADNEKFSPCNEGGYTDAKQADIARKAKKSKQNKLVFNAISLFSAIASMIAAVLGMLVDPVLYALTGVFIAFTVAGVIGRFTVQKRMAALLSELNSALGTSARDIDSGLALLSARAELAAEYSARLTERESARGMLCEALLSLGYTKERYEVCEFAESFISDYEKYTENKRIDSYRKEAAARDAEQAKALRDEVNKFLFGIKITSDDPFGQIRSALTEYMRSAEQISAIRRESESYKALHGVGEVKVETGRVEELDRRLTAIAEERRLISDELALLRREYDRAELELGEYDALAARRAELSEKLEKYERALETIQLTQRYMTAAKDGMTAKYLGKTKSAFEGYASLISGSVGEYDMSTDFGISKIEEGATHPSEYYSRGTQDMLALASRLALLDALYEGERPFVVLDDPFSGFDDGKLQAALRLLRELARDRQIIYFTCTSGRAVK